MQVIQNHYRNKLLEVLLSDSFYTLSDMVKKSITRVADKPELDPKDQLLIDEVLAMLQKREKNEPKSS